VRRRTAEKALFLRPATGIVATPRHELPPARVKNALADNGGATEVFEKPSTSGFVEQVPYSRDDSQTNVLTLNQTVADDDFISDSPLILDNTVSLTQDLVTVDMDTGSSKADIEDAAIDKNPSPIAMAAAEVSERLDRLIDHEQGEDQDQPTVGEYGVQTSAPIGSEHVEPEQAEPEQAGVTNEETGQIFPTMTLVEMDIPGSIDYNLQTPAPEEVENVESKQSGPVLTLVKSRNDVKDGQPVDDNDVPKVTKELTEGEADVQNAIDDSGATSPQDSAPTAALRNSSPNLVEESNSKGIGAYLVALVMGLLLLGGGLWKMKFAPATNTNDWSAFVAPIALLIGGLVLFGGLYYMIKSHINNRTVN